MQTFLPFSDYEKSAKVLDNKRLNKQKVEAMQILRVLAGLTKGWKNHPCVLQWKGYERELSFYAIAMVEECLNRGFKDTCYLKIIDLIKNNFAHTERIRPPWLGDEKFHASHRAALLFKNPLWYSKFHWLEEPKIEYIWPK